MDKNQREVSNVLQLEQLPDHHGFKDCADAARGRDEAVRDDHKMEKPPEIRGYMCLFSVPLLL